jgi:hypothetical protein
VSDGKKLLLLLVCVVYIFAAGLLPILLAGHLHPALRILIFYSSSVGLYFAVKLTEKN